MEQNHRPRENSINNVGYILKMLWHASPFRIVATMFRTITEQVFHVFFFVYLTMYIFTAIETNSSYYDLLWVVGFACLLHIGIHFLSAWYNYYISRNNPYIYKHIFNLIIAKSKELPLVKYEQPEFYDKFARALEEATDRAIQTLEAIARFMAVVISAFATMLLIIQVDSILLLFTILPIICSLVIGKINAKLWYEMGLEKTRSNRVIGYTKRVFYEKKYAGEMRLYNMKELLFKKHREAFHHLYEIDVKFRKKLAIYSSLKEIVFRVLMYFGTMVYIVYCVTSGNAALIGPYIAMIPAVAMLSFSMERAIHEYMGIIKEGLQIQNLRDYLEYRNTEAQEIRSLPVTRPIDEIELRNVSFTYEGSDNPVIDDISLHIRKGEKIALVGHNGAGKTTIVKLIMKLYEVSKGEIRAGGHNIADYDAKQYHSRFGVVFQDFQIFALPLSQNVLMKTPENEEERNRVVQALEKAQFDDKLKQLPNGIDTMITKEFDENGLGLSGGEAQKIAIARVFAKDCDIAILDEPSSALDPIAEFNMYNNMMEAAQNKTVIFISHRLSSARMADKIYMLEHGRIIEEGTHNELMAMNGKYAEMFILQAKSYREEEAKRAI